MNKNLSWVPVYTLLNLSSKLRKRDKAWALKGIFRDEFNKFNNIEAWMIDFYDIKTISQVTGSVSLIRSVATDFIKLNPTKQNWELRDIWSSQFTFQTENNKGPDQTALVFAFVVCKQQSQGFWHRGTYDVEAQASWLRACWWTYIR